MEAPVAISTLELGQFDVDYDDLPYMEGADPIDNAVYRSKRFPKNVFVYHSDGEQWDCFVWT